MKRKMIIWVMCLCVTILLSACGTQDNVATESGRNKSAKLTFGFANAKEGAKFIKDNTDYFSKLNQNDLCYRMQKNDATLEEYINFAANQTLDFTKEEKKAVSDGMQWIMDICRENHYNLPEIGEITFIKTTLKEEAGAVAYTHGTQIYLGDSLLLFLKSEDRKIREQGTTILAHELFHCLTRNDAQFRKDMYEIVDFTVQEEEFEFSSRIQERMISNPDVGRHDSYCTFRIDGQDMDCVMVLTTTRPFEKPGDNMLKLKSIELVPIDNLSVMYSIDQAENFWEVFGKNTEYVLDPEEVMADNFSYAIMFGVNGAEYNSPEIIQAICDYLKK